MKSWFKLGVLAVASSLFMAGCSTTNTTLPGLLPGADQIQVGDKTPDSQNCQALARITSQQTAQPMNARVLEKAAMHQLKNAALHKGANYIHQTRNYSNVTQNSLGANKVSGVTVVGVAYHCQTLPQQASS